MTFGKLLNKLGLMTTAQARHFAREIAVSTHRNYRNLGRQPDQRYGPVADAMCRAWSDSNFLLMLNHWHETPMLFSAEQGVDVLVRVATPEQAAQLLTGKRP